MGGIWSNHLHATAFAADQHGYSSIGLVRGPEMPSATLDDCRACGMQVQFVDRVTYRALRFDPQHWRTRCDVRGSNLYWLPEGGSDPAALHGVAELIEELDFIPDVILLASGTAATLAGLLAGLKGRSRVVGIAVIKNAQYLHAEIARLLQQAGYPLHQNYQLLTNFHHGGYAKISAELVRFCDEFVDQTHIPIEPIYTGKVFYALRELIKSNYFQPHEKVMVLHTGGLQGIRGLNTYASN